VEETFEPLLLSICKGVPADVAGSTPVSVPSFPPCVRSTEMVPSQSIWAGLSARVTLEILSGTSRVILQRISLTDFLHRWKWLQKSPGGSSLAICLFAKVLKSVKMSGAEPAPWSGSETFVFW